MAKKIGDFLNHANNHMTNSNIIQEFKVTFRAALTRMWNIEMNHFKYPYYKQKKNYPVFCCVARISFAVTNDWLMG
jgi:hypothetical protein